MLTNNDNSTQRARIFATIGIVTLCLVSGVAGGALTRNFGVSTYQLSYADFISIMLTAISVLMTVLAIFLAVFGFIGWNSIEQKVHSKTEDFLRKGFEQGERLDQMVNTRVIEVIEKKSTQVMYEGIQGIDEKESNHDVAEDRTLT